mmetsp:Transcript_15557/g.35856  ORF Transcript_15557/g.35856 Transcript_15557/m.35856 type:complete len:209 (+) Transcript_15557:1047-1673(+)
MGRMPFAWTVRQSGTRRCARPREACRAGGRTFRTSTRSPLSHTSRGGRGARRTRCVLLSTSSLPLRLQLPSLGTHAAQSRATSCSLARWGRRSSGASTSWIRGGRETTHVCTGSLSARPLRSMRRRSRPPSWGRPRLPRRQWSHRGASTTLGGSLTRHATTVCSRHAPQSASTSNGGAPERSSSGAPAPMTGGSTTTRCATSLCRMDA